MKQKKTREPKTDCFAYKNNTTCHALTEMMCTYKECPFYKNENEIDYNTINAINRK